MPPIRASAPGALSDPRPRYGGLSESSIAYFAPFAKQKNIVSLRLRPFPGLCQGGLTASRAQVSLGLNIEPGPFFPSTGEKHPGIPCA